MIVVVFGTRPEAIKLGPVVAELKALAVPVRLICTQQHTDLLAGTPAETDLAEAVSLNLPSTGDVAQWLRSAEGPLQTALGSFKDSVVVVQGDTMSALAGCRAARAVGLPVAHVEAGLRSHTLREPCPEEGFRVEIDKLSDWLYAPTSTSYQNLIEEGIHPAKIRVTGNTVVSALARYTNTTPTPGANLLLVTLHRREWLQGKFVRDTITALGEAADGHDITLFWPTHPAVRPYLKHVRSRKLLPCRPLPYQDMIHLLNRSLGVITDSGGLQEEAATLGIPCAVLRNVTDRPESIAAGIAGLFSPTSLGAKEAVHALLAGRFPRKPSNVFGSPEAAHQIARHLANLVR